MLVHCSSFRSGFPSRGPSVAVSKATAKLCSYNPKHKAPDEKSIGAKGGWIVQQEITRSVNGVVRVGGLCDRGSRCEIVPVVFVVTVQRATYGSVDDALLISPASASPVAVTKPTVIRALTTTRITPGASTTTGPIATTARLTGTSIGMVAATDAVTVTVVLPGGAQNGGFWDRLRLCPWS